MTARILIPDGPSATLDDDGVWHSDDAQMEDLLNRLFSWKVIPPSPAAGTSPFSAQAREAARVFKAELRWPAPGTSPAAEGVIY